MTFALLLACGVVSFSLGFVLGYAVAWAQEKSDAVDRRTARLRRHFDASRDRWLALAQAGDHRAATAVQWLVAYDIARNHWAERPYRKEAM